MSKTKDEPSRERWRWAAREIAEGTHPVIVEASSDLPEGAVAEAVMSDTRFRRMVQAYRSAYADLPPDRRIQGVAQLLLRAVEHRLEAGDAAGISWVFKELRAINGPAAPAIDPEAQRRMAAELNASTFLSSLTPEQLVAFEARAWPPQVRYEDVTPETVLAYEEDDRESFARLSAAGRDEPPATGQTDDSARRANSNVTPLFGGSRLPRGESDPDDGTW